VKKFKGVQILEVWDFRLSVAHPLIRNDIGDTWLVQVWANSNPDYDPEKPDDAAQPLEVFDTKIPCETGDHWDAEKMKICYEWLRSVRDKYARDHIELRKPVCRMINDANAMAGGINEEAAQAEQGGDINLFHQKIGELKFFLDDVNAAIKAATKKMHAQIVELEGGTV
jgi:hypothetical protein